ncbi:cation diffusion facilitator family transporter [Gorillibacterium sp. sgz5001074]|uniref:cation diffusion facilitator family transporter n=1 Tax=Gorillibacterium sp. sgz5001074 TaxID=3446695 RepID=UPI003F680495
MSDSRFGKAEKAAWLGIVGNLALAGVKGAIGFVSGSKALMADAVASASDVAGSFAVLVGIKAAKRPADEDHPYGHGKAETIAAIVVSVLMIIIGFEIGRSAFDTLRSGVAEPPNWIALIALGISIAVKEVLFRYNYQLGKKLSSPALIANAWDHRTDVLSSIAASIGVGGALLGKSLDQPKLYLLDPAAGLIVSVLVLRMGYKMIMESVHNTMDHVLHEEDAAELVQAAQRTKGVITVDGLRAREHGHYVIVDVKISVNPRISVSEGHEIAKSVKQHLMKRFIHVADVLVHVNPYDPGYPYKNNVDPDQDEMPTVLH